MNRTTKPLMTIRVALAKRFQCTGAVKSEATLLFLGKYKIRQ